MHDHAMQRRSRKPASRRLECVYDKCMNIPSAKTAEHNSPGVTEKNISQHGRPVGCIPGPFDVNALLTELWLLGTDRIEVYYLLCM